MKNTLADLNNYLFEQLENLSEPEMTSEELDIAIKRSEAVTSVAEAVIQNAELSLKAIKILADSGADISKSQLPTVLGIEAK